MTQTENFDDLRDLYQEVILDHGRRPRHAQRLAAFDATAKGDNPMCGDRVQVWVKLDADTIGQVGFEARGCAISVASADLMAETVQHRSKADTRALFEAFRTMARTGSCPDCAAELADHAHAEPVAHQDAGGRQAVKRRPGRRKVRAAQRPDYL